MAQEVQSILIKYEADIKELRKDLDGAKKELKDFEKEGGKTGKALTNAFKSVGLAIAAAFSVQQVIAFGKELNDLQKEAQGVRQAFNAAFDPGALQRLRDTTKGTLSDLELMKRALAAREFGIGPDLLAKGLEFARVQANKLGLEFDFLAESFVTGAGRKSIQILDNLGISQADLSAKVKETGDFYTALGAIIDEKLGQDGAASVETLADRQNRLNAQIANLKLELSDALLPLFEELTEVAGKAVSEISKLTKFGFGATQEQIALTTQKAQELSDALTIEFSEKLESGALTRDDIITQIGQRIKEVSDNIEFYRKQTRGGTFVADDIARALGFGKRQLQNIDNARDKVLDYSAELEALQSLYERLGLTNDELTKDLDETGLSMEELAERANRLAEELEMLAQIQAFNELFDAEAVEAAVSSNNKIERSYDDLEKKIVEYGKVRAKVTEEAAADAIAEAEAEEARRASIAAAYGNTASAILDFGRTVIQGEQERIRAQLEAGQITEEEARERLQRTATRERSLGIFQLGIDQAVAISQATAAFSKTPFLIPVILASVFGFFAKAKQLIDSTQIPAFAKGTSDAPGGLSLVGEEGPEFVHLPKGARVFTAKATRNEKSLIEAINTGTVDDFIRDTYVTPALSTFADNIARSAPWQSYDDFYLRQAIRANKVVKLDKGTIRALTRNNVTRYH
jgi:hypothetical protein